MLAMEGLLVEYDIQRNGLLVSLNGHSMYHITPATSAWAPCPEMVGPRWILVHDCWPMSQPNQELLAYVADYLLPALYTTGVMQWIWVCSLRPLSLGLLQQVASHLPHPAFSVFHDLEHAVSWLHKELPLAALRPSFDTEQTGRTKDTHGYYSAPTWEEISHILAAASRWYRATQ